MGDNGTNEVMHYRPARTVVKLGGTVMVHTLADGTKSAERVCDVAVATEADPRHELSLLIEERWGRDREFELNLAADERLTGAGYSTTGVGGQVIEAGFRLATLVAKLAPAVAGMGLVPADVIRKETVDQILAKEEPNLFKRRERFAKVIDDLQAALADESENATTRPQTEVLDQIKTFHKALVLMRAEAALLETQFEKWRARRFPDWTQKLSYAIGTDELPRRDEVEDKLVPTDEELTGTTGEVARNLGVVIARIEPSTEPTRSTDSNAVWYRMPRRAQLATYVQDAEHPDEALFRLRDLTHAWIVDSHSEWGDVPIRSGLFAKHGATVEFGDAGTLTHLTNKEVGGAGGVASALSGAGSAVVESLDQATKISAALQPTDPSLTALQDQVMRKELEARLAEATRKVAAGGSATN